MLPKVALPLPVGSTSRRCRQRFSKALATTKLANDAISALNGLHRGAPMIGKNVLGRETGNLSKSNPLSGKTTERAVAQVFTSAQRFQRRLAATGLKSGVYSDTDPVQHEEFIAPRHYSTVTEALPIEAERMSLPSEGKGIQLLDFLPNDLAARYAGPTPDLFRAKEEIKMPAACVRVRSHSDYVGLLRRLMGVGKVHFTKTPKVVNGCFATAKPSGKLRFVFDGRRVSAVFVDPDHVALPTPDLFADLECEEGAELFISKVDISDYYHRIYNNM